MSDDLELAIAAAAAGGRLAMDYFARATQIHRERKLDGSLVTEADRAVEEGIRAMLARARPGDAVLGEEAGGQRVAAGRRWIVDPIDGTVGFAVGDERWLVLVALEDDGVVVAAAAAAPAQRRMWWARRGAGAFTGELARGAPVGPRRLAVRGIPPAGVAAGRLGVVPEPGAYAQDDRLIAVLAEVTPPRSWPVHPALLVAEGELDLAVQTRGQVWDYATTALIVVEAGGRFSGFGGEGHPHAGPALYSSGQSLHDAALRHLNPAPASS